MRFSHLRFSIRATLVALLFIVAALVLLVWGSDSWYMWRHFRTGKQIIAQVEAFRVQRGHLPENMDDVGLSDPDLDVYYAKANDKEYCVWFGTTLGESETYSSRTRQWEPINACP